MSQLREMPEGSAEITTTLIPVEKVGQIVDRLKSRDASDDKVGFLCSRGTITYLHVPRHLPVIFSI